MAYLLRACEPHFLSFPLHQVHPKPILGIDRTIVRVAPSLSRAFRMFARLQSETRSMGKMSTNIQRRV